MMVFRETNIIYTNTYMKTRCTNVFEFVQQIIFDAYLFLEN